MIYVGDYLKIKMTIIYKNKDFSGVEIDKIWWMQK